ncbi:hypothetical protein ASD45_16610 [Pseudolabrys sp. Root1462]|jgi:hypothetical protein|nr:hypothetical protein ASD45_16610 [Pseudolabrys sp. Root1462]
MPHCTMPQWRFLEISEPLQVIERYFLLRGHRPLASTDVAIRRADEIEHSHEYDGASERMMIADDRDFP